MINARIDFDPLNDGIEVNENNVEERTEADKVLILSTKGQGKIVDENEGASVLKRIKEKGIPCKKYLNDKYVAMFNGEKIIPYSESGACLVGSVVIMKRDGNSVACLTDDDIREAVSAFAGRTMTIIIDGQEFTAFEIL